MNTLNIALIGYGKMGKELEKAALERGHRIILTIDSEEDWETDGKDLKTADVAIEFSVPDRAAGNIRRCYAAGVPVVCGTTGWHESLPQLTEECRQSGGGLLYASNFSISVNIFFEINRMLARRMGPFSEYEVNIEEIHHIHKIDAPSGTAIALANDIIRNTERKGDPRPGSPGEPGEIPIKSVRLEDVTGTHIVTYESPIDKIEIRHTSKSRKGFAHGALLAAEFLAGRSGIYTMDDLLALE